MKTSGITCRKATLEDIKDILGLAYQFYQEFIDAPDEDFDEKFVAQQASDVINNKNGAIFLAENGKGPIGVISVWEGTAYYNPSKKAMVDHHLWVQPEYRKGSALKVLLSAARNWAKNKNLVWVRSRVIMGRALKVKRLVS